MGGKRWDVGSEIYDEVSAVDESAIVFYHDIFPIRMWHWPVLWVSHVYEEVDFFSLQVEGFVCCDFNANGSWAVTVLTEIPVQYDYASYYGEGNCGGENNVEAFRPSLHFYPSLPWVMFSAIRLINCYES